VYRFIACPNCGDILGEYNEEREKNRGNDKSYCSKCGCVDIPLYLEGDE